MAADSAPLITKGRQDRSRSKSRDDGRQSRGSGDDDRRLLQTDDYYADDPDGDGDTAELDPLPGPAKAPEAKAGVFVYVLTIAAGISGLLFGYDTGVISATLVSVGTSLSDRTLSSFDKSIITSSTALFALIVSPFSSIIADALGRRRVLLLADYLFIIGALFQSWAESVTFMVLGRAIVGAAVGAASFVTPLYLAELAPSNYRGRLVTVNVLFITMGQVVAYVVGWAFSVYGDEKNAWRWMVGLGAAPAILQVLLLSFMPETPRWLVMVGRSALAKRVLERVSGTRAGSMVSAEAVVRDIESEIREEREVMRQEGSPRLEWWGGWQELFTVGRNRRALTIACLLQGLQQLCGFNSLMYFSATIFSLVGFKTPTLTALSVAVTNFLFTVAALLLVDRVGRRRILLYSLPFMVAGLLLSAYGFTFVDVLQPSEGSPEDAEGRGAGGRFRVAFRSGVADSEADGEDDVESDYGAAVMILVSIMIYVASFAIGLGNVPWMQSELFPLAVRSIGSGVSTATNWGANFVVGLTFLPLMDMLSPSLTFTLYAVVCLVGYVLVWRIYPETAGLSLEEAATLLDRDWGTSR